MAAVRAAVVAVSAKSSQESSVNQTFTCTLDLSSIESKQRTLFGNTCMGVLILLTVVEK